VFRARVRVGSQPWGLALSPDSSILYIANSGGTNISQIPLSGPLPAADNPATRIETPNSKIFEVTRTEKGLLVTEFDYSDRPQFIGQMISGRLLYSTKPTASAPDGTIRMYDPANPRRGVIILAEYARRLQTDPDKFVVMHAENAYVPVVNPFTLVVCDRRLDSGAIACVNDDAALSLTAVSDSLRVLRERKLFDAYFDPLIDPLLIGLSDTTFVAVSGNREMAAFGEGVRSPGRIIAYDEGIVPGDTFLIRAGDTRDLVNNASERVIGLALNADATQGLARGNEGYLFTRDLRLQGVLDAVSPSGAVAMHPSHRRTGIQIAFIPGITPAGAPVIDIVNTFNFCALRRLHLRDPVIGSMAVVVQPSGALNLFAITPGGLVTVEVLASELPTSCP
jgi:hypothetical protein